MTPAGLHTAAGAMRAAAAAMCTGGGRYGDASRAAREPIGALQTVAAGPEVDRFARQGRQFVDRVGDVPGLLITAATSLRAFADDTDRTADAVARRDAQLAELRRQRTLAASSISTTLETHRIDQEQRDVARRRDDLLAAWQRSVERVAREVGGIDRQLASVTRSLHGADLGRAAVTGFGVARGVTTTYGVLDRAGVAAATLGQRHRASRLTNAQHSLNQMRSSASPHRVPLPSVADWGLSPEARHANEARRSRSAAAAIPAAQARVASAQRAVDTNRPLNRASARASQVWNSPARKTAGRYLGPAGYVLGGASMVSDARQGNYGNAALTGVGMAATAAVVAFPVTGAAVVVGVAVVQNREALASAGRWVGGRIKGVLGR